MELQLYSQLLRLDYSNDHLLQMYYVLYHGLPPQEKEMSQNIHQLIITREKIKTELRSHISQLRKAVTETVIGKKIADILPVYLKLEHITKNTFNNSGWALCYKKEQENLRLYYQALHNLNLSPKTVNVLLGQKNRLEAVPK